MRPYSLFTMFCMVMVLIGCSKGYIVHTDIDQKGNKQKVVVTQEVERDWAWFVGSDKTTLYPMTCPYSAIGWNGDLDKEQCTIEHKHLTGPNKGQTELVRYVDATETIGKKILPTLWMAALWGWLLSHGTSSGDQSQTNNQNQTNITNEHFSTKCALPDGKCFK